MAVVNSLTILMIGDIVGEAGLCALEAGLPQLTARYKADFVIVNGENAVEGYGLNAAALERILTAGADIVTSGNHIWEKSDFQPVLERSTDYGKWITGAAGGNFPKTAPFETPRILRPANYPAQTPGAGAALLQKNDIRFLVINLQGREFMTPIDCPFITADKILALHPEVPAIIDFHAESTREKEALGLYLSGRAAAVAGTHTHVQTADARILPGGTAYITDLGMTGPTGGVIGMDAKICVSRAKSQVFYKMQCAPGQCAVQGAAITLDRQNRAAAIESFQLALES